MQPQTGLPGMGSANTATIGSMSHGQDMMVID